MQERIGSTALDLKVFKRCSDAPAPCKVISFPEIMPPAFSAKNNRVNLELDNLECENAALRRAALTLTLEIQALSSIMQA